MIRILKKEVSDKIAAGEVVERPVSIVKELVENSIDAGADAIVLEIQNGGKTYLRVTDNGSGIPGDEIPLAFHRHATSKIQEAADLDQIQSLGFRGEALASISAVSRIEIISKTPDEAVASKCTLIEGTMTECEKTGAPEGTTIIVRDLFFNTPARLKFLKADHTESGLIVDIISRMALAYPEIRFRLINQGQTLFSTRGDGDLNKTIDTLYGRITGGKLLPVHAQEGNMKLSGYISDPGETRANRRNQFYFVNGRTVSSRLLEEALTQGYHMRLFEGRQPVAFLFFSIDSREVDVNIHPNKKEVRFHKEKDVSDFVAAAVKESLHQPEAIPGYRFKRASAEGKPKDFKENNRIPPERQEQVDIKNILSSIREDATEPRGEKTDPPLVLESREEILPPRRERPGEIEGPKESFPEIRLIGSVFNTYLLGESDDILYLIDQHAAHERILFEEIMERMEGQHPDAQHLMIPFTISLGAAHAEGSALWMSALARIGYEISLFGPGIYRVSEIPSFFTLSEAELFVTDFLDQFRDEDKANPKKSVETAAMRACKQAVKAGDSLGGVEASALLSALAQCKEPYSCPHGRPVFIRMTKGEMERRFLRS